MHLRQPVAAGLLRLKFGEFSHIDSVVLRVTSESGENGYGAIEATPPIALPADAVLAVVKLFRAAVVDADALDPESVMKSVDNLLFDLNYSFNPIRAGIDCALHDLAARIHGVSLSTYLGSQVTEPIAVLDLLPLEEPQLMDASIMQALNGGARAVKVKMNGDTGRDMDRVSRVRELVGPDVAIVCDANGSYERDAALVAANRLAEKSVVVFEQPLARRDIDGMAWLTSNASLAIEADESVLSMGDAETVVARGGAACISLRIARFGGIAQTMQVARLCQENDMTFRFGAMFLPGVHDAIAASLAAALPLSPYPHELAMHRLFANDPFEGLELSDGLLRVDTDRPGAGVDLKPDHGDFIDIGA